MRQSVDADDFTTRLGRMSRVVTAMMLREVKTRFGRHRFGFVWVLIEPIVFLTGFLAIRMALETHAPFGENLALFVLDRRARVSRLLLHRQPIDQRADGQSRPAGLSSGEARRHHPVAEFFSKTMIMFVVWMIFFTVLAATSATEGHRPR